MSSVASQKGSVKSSQVQTPVKSLQSKTQGTKSQAYGLTGDYQSLLKQLKEKDTELNELRCNQRQVTNSEAIINDLQQENDDLRKKLAESEKAREHFQDKIVSATDIKQDLNLKQERFKDMLHRENNELKAALTKKDSELRDREGRIDYLKTIVNEIELEKHQMSLTISENQAAYKVNENTIFESEEKRVQLQTEYEKCLDEYNFKLKSQYSVIDKLNQEMEELRKKILIFEKEANQFKFEKLTLEKQLKEEQDKTKKMKELEKILADVKAERDLLLKHLQQEEEERSGIQKKFKDMKQENENLLQKLKDDMDKLRDSKLNLLKELMSKDEELGKKDAQVKDLTQKQLDLGEAMAQFQTFLDAHNDLKKQLAQAKQESSDLRDQKAGFYKQLQDSNDLLKIASMGSTEFQDKIKELMQRLREQDEEIEAMKRYVQSMRAKYQIYIPDKDDPIDNQLAEYINNYPERSKLRIMFMKETDGVYQFGSKRVYVRVERDKITVRVGGGYLSLDEFLDIYTPMEMERVERNDPIKKFSEKVAIQKTLQMQSPSKSPHNLEKVKSPRNNGKGVQSPSRRDDGSFGAKVQNK